MKRHLRAAFALFACIFGVANIALVIRFRVQRSLTFTQQIPQTSDCDKCYGWPLLKRWKNDKTRYCSSTASDSTLLFCKRVLYNTLNNNNENKSMAICQSNNVIMDFSRIKHDGKEYKLQDASFQGHCVANYSLLKTVPSHFKELLLNLQTFSQPPFSKCSKWITEPLYIVKRTFPMNIYHAMTDWFNAWVTMHVMDVTSWNVVLLDDHSADPAFDFVWNKVLSASNYMRHKDLAEQGKVCYKQVIFAESGVSSLLMQPNLFVNCGRSSLYQDFANHFLDKMDLSSEPKRKRPRVTVILRKDGNGKTVHRQFQNEKEMIDALEQGTNNVDITVVDLVKLSLHDQIKLMRETDVLLGAHGAGLTHVLFLPPKSVLIEFGPVSAFYKNLALLSGHEYLSFGEGNYFRHVIPVNVQDMMHIINNALNVTQHHFN
jgi:hypothetical protein